MNARLLQPSRNTFESNASPHPFPRGKSECKSTYEKQQARWFRNGRGHYVLRIRADAVAFNEGNPCGAARPKILSCIIRAGKVVVYSINNNGRQWGVMAPHIV